MAYSRMPIAAKAVRRWRRLILALPLIAAANAGCAKSEPSKDQLLTRANEAFKSGQYRKAEQDYRAVLRVAAEEPAALRRLGILYYDQGQLAQAFPLLKRAAELQPDDADVQVKLGLIYLSARRLQEARDIATQVLENQAGNEQALLLLIDTALTSEEIDETRKLIQNLREQDQDRPAYHIALGALDLRQRRTCKEPRMNSKPHSLSILNRARPI